MPPPYYMMGWGYVVVRSVARYLAHQSDHSRSSPSFSPPEVNEYGDDDDAAAAAAAAAAAPAAAQLYDGFGCPAGLSGSDNSYRKLQVPKYTKKRGRAVAWVSVNKKSCALLSHRLPYECYVMGNGVASNVRERSGQ